MVKIHIQEDGVTVNTLSLMVVKADSFGAREVRRNFPIVEVVNVDTGAKTFEAILASGQKMLVDGCTVDELYPTDEEIVETVEIQEPIVHTNQEPEDDEPPLPPWATDAEPGSDAKKTVIAWRLKYNYQLHHPNDRKVETELEEAYTEDTDNSDW